MRSLALSICLLTLFATAPVLAQAKAPTPCPCELVVDGARFLAGAFAKKEGEARAPERQPNLSEGRVEVPRCAEHKRAHLAKAARVDAMVEPAGSADASDAKLVENLLLRLPNAHVLQLLEQRTRVIVVREGVAEYFEDLKAEEPAGWPEGTTFEDVPALFHPDLNMIVIAVDHGAKGGPALPRGGMTLLHELGHALDPSSHGGEGSTSAAFRAAHDRDADALAEHLQIEGDRGRSEAYAEAYARFVAGDTEWFNTAPELSAYWKLDPLADYFDAPASESKTITILDDGRPIMSWIAAPKEDGPTRYRVHLKDGHGNKWVVGDSVRDAFKRVGKTLVFAPRNLGLASGQLYAWRVEAKSKAALSFSAWQQVRTPVDAEQRRSSLQGGLPLPFVHSAKQAVRIGAENEAEAPHGCTPNTSQGLSGAIR